MSNSWHEANRNYVEIGYTTARAVPTGGVPPDMKGYQFERRMKELYGDDEANWDRVGFSQIWLNEYLAKNPFVKKGAEEVDVANQHEFTLASGTGVDGDDVVSLSLKAILATDIVPEALRWLWQDRIVYGKICLFSGKPGCGKTLAVLDLIARVTTGADWPDGAKNLWGPKKVLLACSEDGLEDTVVPRLNGAGADLKNVIFIHRVLVNGDTQRQLQLDSDTSLLKKALKDNPDIGLVVLDPLTSFFGDININVDKEVRPVMDALSKICNATGVSFISVIHHNKRSDVDALQKILGASSLVGAVRTIWGFSRDPEDKQQHFMTLVKSNLSAKDSGLKYTIGEKEVLGIKAAHIVWGEETDQSANDLLDKERDTTGRRDNKQIDLARAFLPFALKSKGIRPCAELYREAEAEGISVPTLKRAKNDFPIRVIKQAHNWAWLWREDDPMAGEGVI